MFILETTCMLAALNWTIHQFRELLSQGKVGGGGMLPILCQLSSVSLTYSLALGSRD